MATAQKAAVLLGDISSAATPAQQQCKQLINMRAAATSIVTPNQFLSV
jgi:hypothetical protein